MESPLISSYYGLCLVKARAQLFEGLRICQDALTLERHNPDIYYNLAQVYLLCGKQKSAVSMLYRGLEYEQLMGNSNKILQLLQKLVARRQPFCKWLPRNHPLNKYVGKLTYARANRIRIAEIHRSESRAQLSDYLFMPLLGMGSNRKQTRNRAII
jgi:hypothetical protein